MAIPLFLSTGVKALDIVVAILGASLAICGGTYIFTSCRFWFQSRGNAGRFQGREPLILPYSIPYLAGFPRLMNPHAMYEYALRKAPQNAPVKLLVGPIAIYVLFGDKNIRMIFKNSKASKESSSKLIMRSSGMKPKDQAVFTSDTSGIGIVPQNPVPEEKRIWRKTHETGVTHLASGPSVNQLTNGFMTRFVNELNKNPVGHSFTVPVWDYVKKSMFVASTTALAGSEIFRVNPDLVKTYWDFDEAFLMIAIGLPKLLYPQGPARRDCMLNSAIRWLESAHENFDERDRDPEWDPLFGSAYMRNMIADMKNGGVSTHGQAAALLSIIWAINSNAIPCAVWILLESFQRPGLVQRLREEITPAAYTDSQGELTIDITKLVSQCPLLTSIYQECLRTRASNTITRKLEDDLECDGYILKKGSFLMSPSWLPMHGPLWDVPGHPAKDFWPERFIEMPKLAPKDSDGKSQFEAAMKTDNWFPYGGGAMICTGRFFAKQEILVAAALLILKFDFEPKEWIMHSGKQSSRPAMPDEAFAGSGILPPDRDLMVTMRRAR
ncbi:related to cytochrome P450 7B1 [Phialocephala subalpina]|uniref:Related to cytochrome P450 7B1 n=1 Tax=Phialocephala subalpina TaxID=576137 RepID=A0A1L7XIF9_9HELO|nr:related to cytochrome P450 7B1 [Phialocephala subalpina]